MNAGLALALSFGIGVVAGLRSMTAPAVVAWAAHLGWINLTGSPLAFIGSIWAVSIFTLGALGEFIADQLPSTPPRTKGPGLIARIVMGLLTGAGLALAGGASLIVGAILGALGSLVGAFGGYYARTGLVRSLRVPDFVVAIPEDLIAVGLGLLLVTRL